VYCVGGLGAVQVFGWVGWHVSRYCCHISVRFFLCCLLLHSPPGWRCCLALQPCSAAGHAACCRAGAPAGLGDAECVLTLHVARAVARARGACAFDLFSLVRVQGMHVH